MLIPDKPTQAWLSERFVERLENDLVYSIELSSWLRYEAKQAGVWSVLPDEQIQSSIKDLTSELLGERFNASLVEGSYRLTRIDRRILKSVMPTPASVVIFRNGALDLASGELEPHSAENNALWALERNFDPSKCNWTPIAQFVSRALRNPADQDRLVCYHAAVVRDLFIKLDGKNTLLQVGKSRCGKGTSTRLLEALVGERNVKPIESIQAMQDNSFVLEGIEVENPRLIVFLDQSELNPRANIDRFLALTGKDRIQVNRKGRKVVKYLHSGGLLINSTGYVFSKKHRQRGLTRRSILIGSWQKDELLKGIEAQFSDEVLTAYTNFLLSLLEEFILKTLQDAPGEPTIEEEAQDDPMIAWFADCIEVTGHSEDRVQLGADKAKLNQLFGSYHKYCSDGNMGDRYSKNRVTFAQDFERLYERVRQSHKDDSSRQFETVKPGNKLHYTGIYLKPEVDDSSRFFDLDEYRKSKNSTSRECENPVQIGLMRLLEGVIESEISELVADVTVPSGTVTRETVQATAIETEPVLAVSQVEELCALEQLGNSIAQLVVASPPPMAVSINRSKAIATGDQVRYTGNTKALVQVCGNKLLTVETIEGEKAVISHPGWADSIQPRWVLLSELVQVGGIV